MNKKSKIINSIITTIFILMVIVILAYLIIDLYEPIKDLFLYENRERLDKTLESYGIWKYIIMVMISAAQVFLTVMPGEPTEILSGMICGPYYGILACMVGVAIGNTILFVLTNSFNLDFKQAEKNKDSVNNLLKKNKSSNMRAFTWFILGLYFAPFIPYGVIAYTAAKGKMKYPRYILVTTFGTLPSILACVAASTLFLKSYKFSLEDFIPLMIFGVIVLILFALTIKYKKKIIEHVINRSFRATVIWILPFLLLSTLLCFFLLSKKYITTAVFFLLLIIYIICYSLFGEKLSRVFTVKKMDYFKNNIVIKHNRLLYWLMTTVVNLFRKRFNVKIDKNGITKFPDPSIILFNHPSSIDFVNIWAPLYPQKANMVTAYYYFCNFHLGRLLNKVGCFPKFLYQPDISAAKNMHKVIMNKGHLLMAPEGRLSAYGELESYIPSTIKFLKKEQCDVYIAKSEGTYFTKPKWAKTYRKGRVDITYSHLFSKDDLERLSYEEIYKRLYDALYYNEYDWMEKNKVPFKGKRFAEGLEHILYHCPVCDREFTYESKKDTLTCSHCHTNVRLNKYYELECENYLIPKTIRDWYLLQKNLELKKIRNSNYTLKSRVTLKLPDPKGNGFVVAGKGECTLTTEGIRYIGTIYSIPVEKFFKLENIPALPFGVNEDFEIYHDQTLYYFVPDNIRECAKWSVVEEQMYEELQRQNKKEPWDV